ncbi:MAG: ImmA/IrrE family metallo-endopeptidase [Anaerostipes sp.]|nr:ImmA/IrrE family metallo-endopeptidase [Anaerostipes sp.]
MADRSFTEYVKHTFDNQLWKASEDWYEDNKDSVEVDESILHKIGELEIERVTVQYVWVEDAPDMRIRFDVAVEVEFSVAEGDYHFDNDYQGKDWLMIRCEGDLAKDLRDFTITDVNHYDGKSRRHEPLSDALVPYIKKTQLDTVAENILRKYCPKALLQPMELDPEELAKKMGLTVRMENITKDGSIFGRTFFYDCDAELYNPDTNEMYTVPVKAGTIMVDKTAYFMYVLGASHNTIVHECVHWELHKKPIALARLYNDSLSSIGCEVVGGIAGNTKESLDWMEWQANNLAPKIQMPKEMFKKYVDGLITKYRRELGEYDIIDVIEPIISEISLNFGVSKTAAKIRLLEIGRTEAQGAFIYVDGEHIPPHKTGVALEVNQTYSIGAQDAAILPFQNPELRKILDTGMYIYVESHYVLNHSRYVEYDLFGNLKLSHYARNHMDECCLLFDLSVKSKVCERYHSECFLNRESVGELVGFDITYRGGYQNSPDKQGKLLDEYMEWTMKLQKQLTLDYTESMNNLITELGISYASIGRETDLNEATVRRNINGETFKLETLVMILLGMHLPYTITEQIITMSPGTLMPNNPSHQWYKFALQHLYAKKPKEIRAFLEEHGANPL